MTPLDDSLLVAFVDGELEPGVAREVAAQLAADPEAQEKVRLLRASAVLVRTAFADPAYQTVSPALLRRVTRPAMPRSRRFALRLAGASVAAAVAGFAGGFAVSRRRAPTGEERADASLLEEVASYHTVYAQDADRLGEIPASQAEQIKAAFGRVLHRPLPIPDLSRVGLMFQGARLLVVDGRAVPQLLYAWPNHPTRPLGLCIAAGAPEDPSIRTEHRDGVNLAIWGGGGYTYVLVGWIGPGMLTALAAELRPKLAL